MKNIFLFLFVALLSANVFAQNNIKKVGDLNLSPPRVQVGNFIKTDILVDENNLTYISINDDKISLNQKEIESLSGYLSSCIELYSKNSLSNYSKFIGRVDSSNELCPGYVSVTFLNRVEKKETAINILIGNKMYLYALKEYIIKEMLALFEEGKKVSEKINIEINKLK